MTRSQNLEWYICCYPASRVICCWTDVLRPVSVVIVDNPKNKAFCCSSKQLILARVSFLFRWCSQILRSTKYNGNTKFSRRHYNLEIYLIYFMFCLEGSTLPDFVWLVFYPLLRAWVCRQRLLFASLNQRTFGVHECRILFFSRNLIAHY